MRTKYDYPPSTSSGSSTLPDRRAYVGSRIPMRLCISNEDVGPPRHHCPDHSASTREICVSPAYRNELFMHCTSPVPQSECNKGCVSPGWLPPSPSPSWTGDPMRFVHRRPHTPDRAWSPSPESIKEPCPGGYFPNFRR